MLWRPASGLITLLIGFTACTTPSSVGPLTKVGPTTTQENQREIQPKIAELEKPSLPKNIIFMIGDGMGISQITAGLFSNNNYLELEQFPVIGLHKPYSSDNLITDSAAGATAFSAGVKTYNGAIGVDQDTLPVTTILELAEEAGMATGLIATSSIVHATPASFIAHNSYRKNYENIAADFLNTEVDLLIGGGLKYFQRRDQDERNLVDELKANGYTVNNYVQKLLHEISWPQTGNFAYFTADSEPIPQAQGRDYLIPAVTKAPPFLEKRSQNEGFFLMIEGSQIDWGGHANDHDYIVTEMLEFDKAIGLVLDYAKQNGETLVIVTADHETGGYAINYGSTRDSLVPAFTSDYHTADLIPVFAYGPGASEFAGIYENTAIFDKMTNLLGLKEDQ
ncbi:MAG: alkaline phosphatase [Bacteroidota bacterium]